MSPYEVVHFHRVCEYNIHMSWDQTQCKQYGLNIIHPCMCAQFLAWNGSTTMIYLVLCIIVTQIMFSPRWMLSYYERFTFIFYFFDLGHRKIDIISLYLGMKKNVNA